MIPVPDLRIVLSLRVTLYIVYIYANRLLIGWSNLPFFYWIKRSFFNFRKANEQFQDPYVDIPEVWGELVVSQHGIGGGEDASRDRLRGTLNTHQITLEFLILSV